MKEKDPEIDTSMLTKEQKEEMERKPLNLAYFIFVGIIIVLMAICIVVISLLNK